MKCKICLNDTQIAGQVEGVNVRYCNNCKFVFYETMPIIIYDRTKKDVHYKNLKKENYFKTILTSYIEKNMRFLDIGCATGLSVRIAKNLGAYAYGIDLDNNMLDWGRKNFKLDTLCCGTLETFKFKDNSFDIIFMNHTIEHIYDLENLIIEIKRILRRNGKLIIICPNFMRLYKKELIGGDHVNYFNNQNIIKLFDTHNFKVIKNLKTKNWKYNLYYKLNYLLKNKMNLFQIWLTFTNEK